MKIFFVFTFPSQKFFKQKPKFKMNSVVCTRRHGNYMNTLASCGGST